MTPSTLKRRRLLVLAAGLAGAWPLVQAAESDADVARATVEKARTAFEDVLRQPGPEGLRVGLRSARGVLVFPAIVKGGLIVGGSGGTGVLLMRDASGWSPPAFYTLGAISVGLQLGGQSAEVVILATSQKAVDSLLSNSVKFGGEVSVAAGDVGTGKAAAVTADFVSYARARGAFAGASVEGSVLDVRDSLNHAFYGQAVTPADILVRRSVASRHADALLAVLRAAAP